MRFSLYLAGIGLSLYVSLAMAEQATLAVASNFLATAKQLAHDFQQSYPHTVRISAGSTGKLFAQISHGAPYDVFLAADAKRPRMLEENGVADPGSRFTYAEGRIILASLNKTDCKQALQKGAFRHLAMANPKTAPYGEAARSVLNSLQLWDPSRRNIVYGENISQTLQFVFSGNAELGFVAYSQLLALPAGSFKCQWLPPSDSYAPLEQQAVLLKRALQNTAAKLFLQYLKSDAAKAIISVSGYNLPR